MITTIATKPLSPLLRWVGGKYNQPHVYDRLIQLYAPYRDTHAWVEPFCGGLGATMRVMPERAILSDSNKWLIRFYQSIKDGNRWEPEYLGLPYDELRSLLNKEIARDGYGLARPEFATVFYLVNRLCFNGLWRVNKSGEHNVPQGRKGGKKKGQPLDATLVSLDRYFAAMNKWQIDCDPWQMRLTLKSNGIEVNRSSRFIYIDPPYDSTFDKYSAGGFSWHDQVRLAEWAAQSPHPVVLSNASTDRIISLYKSLGFNIELVQAKRSVSCNGDRAKVMEVLATNAKARGEV